VPRQARLFDEGVAVVVCRHYDICDQSGSPTRTSEPALLKTGVLGRPMRTREQRQRILGEYERSAVSGPKFAALCDVEVSDLCQLGAVPQAAHQLLLLLDNFFCRFLTALAGLVQYS
jgi:hypothetical protein